VAVLQYTFTQNNTQLSLQSVFSQKYVYRVYLNLLDKFQLKVLPIKTKKVLRTNTHPEIS